MMRSSTPSVVCLSLLLSVNRSISYAQLSNIPKRFRNERTSRIIVEDHEIHSRRSNYGSLRTREFGRNGIEVEEIENELLLTTPMSIQTMCMSFSMSMSFSMPSVVIPTPPLYHVDQSDVTNESKPTKPRTDSKTPPETTVETPPEDDVDFTTRRINLVGLFLLVPFLFVGCSKR